MILANKTIAHFEKYAIHRGVRIDETESDEVEASPY